MPITPSMLLPIARRAEVVIGTVVDVSARRITIHLSTGLRMHLLADDYTVGQRVVIALPGGEVAGAQILGPATGQVSDVRQVLV